MADKQYVWFERKQDRTPTGLTIAVIHDGDMRYIGFARCSPKDEFRKKAGAVKALGRAKGMQLKSEDSNKDFDAFVVTRAEVQQVAIKMGPDGVPVRDVKALGINAQKRMKRVPNWLLTGKKEPVLHSIGTSSSGAIISKAERSRLPPKGKKPLNGRAPKAAATQR